MYLQKNMYHTVRTTPKSNHKNYRNRSKIDTATPIYDTTPIYDNTYI